MHAPPGLSHFTRIQPQASALAADESRVSQQPGAPRLTSLEPPLSPAPIGSEPPLSGTPPPTPLLRAAELPATVPPAPQVTLEAQLLRFRMVAPDQMSEAMKIEAETGKSVADTVVERGWVSADDLAKVVDSLNGDAAPAPAPVPAPVPAPAPGVIAPLPEPEPAPAPVAVAPPPPPPAPAPVVEVAPPPPPAPVTPLPEPEPEPELPPAAVALPEPHPAPEPPAAPPPPLPPVPAPSGAPARVVVRLLGGEELDVGRYDDVEQARTRAKEIVAEVQTEDNWVFVDGRALSPDQIERIFLSKS